MKVNKKEFDKFLKEYPNKLETDCFMGMATLEETFRSGFMLALLEVAKSLSRGEKINGVKLEEIYDNRKQICHDKLKVYGII